MILFKCMKEWERILVPSLRKAKRSWFSFLGLFLLVLEFVLVGFRPQVDTCPTKGLVEWREEALACGMFLQNNTVGRPCEDVNVLDVCHFIVSNEKPSFLGRLVTYGSAMFLSVRLCAYLLIKETKRFVEAVVTKEPHLLRPLLAFDETELVEYAAVGRRFDRNMGILPWLEAKGVKLQDVEVPHFMLLGWLGDSGAVAFSTAVVMFCISMWNDFRIYLRMLNKFDCGPCALFYRAPCGRAWWNLAPVASLVVMPFATYFGGRLLGVVFGSLLSSCLMVFSENRSLHTWWTFTKACDFWEWFSLIISCAFCVGMPFVVDRSFVNSPNADMDCPKDRMAGVLGVFFALIGTISMQLFTHGLKKYLFQGYNVLVERVFPGKEEIAHYYNTSNEFAIVDLCFQWCGVVFAAELYPVGNALFSVPIVLKSLNSCY